MYVYPSRSSDKLYSTVPGRLDLLHIRMIRTAHPRTARTHARRPAAAPTLSVYTKLESMEMEMHVQVLECAMRACCLEGMERVGRTRVRIVLSRTYVGGTHACRVPTVTVVPAWSLALHNSSATRPLVGRAS